MEPSLTEATCEALKAEAVQLRAKGDKLGAIAKVKEIKKLKSSLASVKEAEAKDEAQLKGMQWAMAVLSDKEERRRLCEAEFKVQDVDGNGTLDKIEAYTSVERMCVRFHLAMPLADKCAQLFALCDKSGDGLIQLDEYQRYFKCVLESCVKKAKSEYDARHAAATSEDEAATTPSHANKASRPLPPTLAAPASPSTLSSPQDTARSREGTDSVTNRMHLAVVEDHFKPARAQAAEAAEACTATAAAAAASSARSWTPPVEVGKVKRLSTLSTLSPLTLSTAPLSTPPPTLPPAAHYKRTPSSSTLPFREVAQAKGVEWASLLLSTEPVRRALCNAEFAAADANGDGTLDRGETFACVGKVCKRFELAMPNDERCAQLFARSDSSGDGFIQIDEFYTFFCTLLECCVLQAKHELGFETEEKAHLAIEKKHASKSEKAREAAAVKAAAEEEDSRLAAALDALATAFPLAGSGTPPAAAAKASPIALRLPSYSLPPSLPEEEERVAAEAAAAKAVAEEEEEKGRVAAAFLLRAAWHQKAEEAAVTKAKAEEEVARRATEAKERIEADATLAASAAAFLAEAEEATTRGWPTPPSGRSSEGVSRRGSHESARAEEEEENTTVSQLSIVQITPFTTVFSASIISSMATSMATSFKAVPSSSRGSRDLETTSVTTGGYMGARMSPSSRAGTPSPSNACTMPPGGTGALPHGATTPPLSKASPRAMWGSAPPWLQSPKDPSSHASSVASSRASRRPPAPIHGASSAWPQQGFLVNRKLAVSFSGWCLKLASWRQMTKCALRYLINCLKVRGWTRWTECRERGRQFARWVHQSARKAITLRVSRGWRTWREVCGVRSVTVRLVQRAASFFLHLAAAWAFASWTQSQRFQREFQRGADALTGHALRLLRQQSLARCWYTWRTTAVERAGKLGALRRTVQHLSHRYVARALKTWTLFALELGAMRETLRGGLLSMIHHRMGRSFGGWVDACLAARESADRLAVMRRVLTLLLLRKLRYGWSSWRAAVSAREDACAALRRAVGLLTGHQISRAWNCWLDALDLWADAMHRLRSAGSFVFERKAKLALRAWEGWAARDRLAKRVLSFLRQHELGRGWLAWRARWERQVAIGAELMKASAVLIRFTKRGLTRGYCTWVDAWRSRAHAADVMRHGISHLSARTLSCAWNTWTKASTLSVAGRACVGRALAHLLSSALARAWSTWAERHDASGARLIAARRTIWRMVNRLTALGWNAWHGRVEEQQALLASLRRMLAYLVHRQITRSWNAWAELAAARAEALELLGKGVASFSSHSLSRSFASWAHAMEVRSARRRRGAALFTDAVRVFTDHLLARGFNVWKALWIEFEWRKGEVGDSHQRVVGSLRHRGLSRALRTWAEACSRQLQLLTILGHAARVLRRQHETRAVASWMAFVDARQAIVHHVTRAVALLRSLHLGKGWRSWAEAVVKSSQYGGHARTFSALMRQGLRFSLHHGQSKAWNSWRSHVHRLAAAHASLRATLTRCLMHLTNLHLARGFVNWVDLISGREHKVQLVRLGAMMIDGH